MRKLQIPEVKIIQPLATLLGHKGPLVACRIPSMHEPEWLDFNLRGQGSGNASAKSYASRDGTEVMSPTARDVIVPGPVDSDFRTYLKDMFNVEFRLHALDNPATFSTEMAIQALERYKNAEQPLFYGWWALRDLPSRYQLLTPAKQRLANSKEWLRQIYPSTVLPRQQLYRDPRIANKYEKTLKDISKNDFLRLLGDEGHVWVKASKELMAGRGVARARTIDDVWKFYAYLKDLGLEDASLILEEHLPGDGRSFTLVRRIDGKVQFNHITKQLNVDGKRRGNIIHSVETASPVMLDLINLTASRLTDPLVVPDDMPGIYAFDTIEDRYAQPKPNDPAHRTTGTWTPATHRISLINSLNLSDRDTVTMTCNLYLDPNTSFNEMMKALGNLSEWKNNGIVTILQYYKGYGTVCVHQAYTTTDQTKLGTMEQDVRAALTRAGIGNMTTHEALLRKPWKRFYRLKPHYVCEVCGHGCPPS